MSLRCGGMAGASKHACRGARRRRRLTLPILPPSPDSPPPHTHQNSEAKARASNAQAGDREFVEAAARFLLAAAERQLRMAPDKGERWLLE